MSKEFQVSGTNKAALFSLNIYRGDGMALLGMDWKRSRWNCLRIGIFQYWALRGLPS